MCRQVPRGLRYLSAEGEKSDFGENADAGGKGGIAEAECV
jgi:hypothetical protein